MVNFRFGPGYLAGCFHFPGSVTLEDGDLVRAGHVANPRSLPEFHREGAQHDHLPVRYGSVQVLFINSEFRPLLSREPARFAGREAPSRREFGGKFASIYPEEKWLLFHIIITQISLAGRVTLW